MPILYLTVEQHQQVVRRLIELGKSRAQKIPHHSAGFGYTSLMVCFLMHNISVAQALLRLLDSFGDGWFPITVGYTVIRTIFETNITAHYITKNPTARAQQYIDFGAVLNKRQMDECLAHRNSKKTQWREAMELVWQQEWASQQADVQKKFDAIASRFTRVNRKNKKVVFQNWSGKKLRDMAVEVDHAEAYDIFYAELSSFAHVDVHLADRFLQRRSDGPVWSQRASEYDVGNVFRYAASFLTCYLKLFGCQFQTWSEEEVQNCWQMTK